MFSVVTRVGSEYPHLPLVWHGFSPVLGSGVGSVRVLTSAG